MPKTVVIADDHPSFRASARAILQAEGFEVVGEAEDGASTIAAVRELHRMSCCSTSSSRISTASPSAASCSLNGGRPAVVLVSSRDACDYGELIEQSGARGFIAKAELSGPALADLLG